MSCCGQMARGLVLIECCFVADRQAAYLDDVYARNLPTIRNIPPSFRSSSRSHAYLSVARLTCPTPKKPLRSKLYPYPTTRPIAKANIPTINPLSAK